MPVMRKKDIGHWMLDVRRGFTLVELLVVIGIIGILIGLSVVAFQATRVSARDAKRKADIAEIRSSLEIYRTDCGEYPSALTFGSALSGGVTVCTGNVYMPTVPNDPINASGSRKYYYARLSVNTYELCASLEQGGSATCGGSCTATCNYRATNP
ncbi:MAG: hypothetical protein A3A62_01725 [Candidatus Blackburnbacteria bacterium RIFCSPLOWO2_01_FULL_44_43]|nr:MAG: hypothetical protein A3A62_01725 [Candidatus Blackburnbacteria bacterium RIFCSPLOWO2_01_FULL_44_43]